MATAKTIAKHRKQRTNVIFIYYFSMFFTGLDENGERKDSCQSCFKAEFPAVIDKPNFCAGLTSHTNDVIPATPSPTTMTFTGTLTTSARKVSASQLANLPTARKLWIR